MGIVRSEDASVRFLEFQIEENFSGVMERYIIEDLEWIETPEDRAVAYMVDSEFNKTNLIVLFPPFTEEEPNN